MNETSESTARSPSDVDLLDAWNRDRHDLSLADLVRRYSPMVLSVCRRRCRSEADADDAYQTTFLYLARNADKIRSPERLAGWLHRVAQRAATATLHDKYPRSEPMVDPPAVDCDPLERLARRHQAIALDEELAELPADYRAVIVMHWYEGMSVSRLADRLETTTGSVRGKLQRGKRLLATRLRRRGIVPLVAFASANACSVTSAESASAAQRFTDNITQFGLPDSPIAISSLDSLLTKGTHAMPTFATTGIIGATALMVALAIIGGSEGPIEPHEVIVTVPAEQHRTEATFQVAGEVELEASDETQELNPKSPAAATGNRSGMGMVWVQAIRTPEPKSPTALQIMERLESPVEGPLNLQKLEAMEGIPLFFDQRAIAEAKVDIDSAKIQFDGKTMPLRSALRKMLQPHGLKYEIEDDGMVITADFEELSRRGFPMSRWIDPPQQSQDRFAKELDQQTTQEFKEISLTEAMQIISERHDIPFVIDEPALEEIGLSPAEPVTLSVPNISLRSTLELMLRPLDLTYTTKYEVLEITTLEKAEQNLLSRIYWLEGTGFPAGDFDSIIEMIETTLHPETWEALGGPSTMQPLNQKRRGLIVSTTLPIHEKIERMLTVFRDGNFGQQAIIDHVQVPAIPGQRPFGGGGGYGYGGGGGGFGGGGGGGGGGGQF